ncbi:MAG: hypothetical protein WKG07_33020 [Hymenobacter sp.]
MLLPCAAGGAGPGVSAPTWLDWNHAGSIAGLFNLPYVTQMLTVDNYSVAFSGHRAAHGPGAAALLALLRGGRRAQPGRVLLAAAVFAGGAIMMVSYNHLHHAVRGH